jgi:hypothetical protein
MLSLIEDLVCRLAAASSRPDWTLLAIANLVSAAIVLIMRSTV